ncbi:MAG TPA: ribosome maturation factor RimM [Thermoanaerobaculia bacterium]|nr:ribosome maturation factor RimM [Thermoanaerobaculia bacterium]
MSDRIAVGIIRKAHGVRGEASVEPWTDSVDRFDELRDVTLVSPDETKTRDARIESTRAHAGRALVKFEGIDAPEDVVPLHNWTVEIAEAHARKLEVDEYFLHDLIGLTLVDAEGRERGVVIDAYEGGGGVLLNVKRADGRAYEVPFAAQICVAIDVAGKRIVVDLPEGLDDLDAVQT